MNTTIQYYKEAKGNTIDLQVEYKGTDGGSSTHLNYVFEDAQGNELNWNTTSDMFSNIKDGTTHTLRFEVGTSFEMGDDVAFVEIKNVKIVGA